MWYEQILEFVLKFGDWVDIYIRVMDLKTILGLFLTGYEELFFQITAHTLPDYL